MMFWDSEVAKRLLAQGALRPLDVQFARFIGKQAVLAGHNKLTVSVGEFCSRKVLGVCLQKKRSYCQY